MKQTTTIENMVDARRRKSQIIPPMNKRITYKGKPGLLLNDYGNGTVYFKLDGDQTISCDKSETIMILL